MRIAFICSCLEPGRDGVGDYARRLAVELIRQGQEVRILAINDKPKILKHETECARLKTNAENRVQKVDIDSQVSEFLVVQESELTSVECMRLPGSLSWSERVRLAGRWLESFSPDLVSLQFVPFGFHPKGLCVGLGRRLADMNAKAPWHIMFHELWVLWQFPVGLRKRLLGQCQKFLLRSCIGKLKPRLVTTQLSVYQAELFSIGVAADLVPLHGNIPVYPPKNAEQWLVERTSLPVGREYVRVGFFGNLLPTLSLTSLEAQLERLGARQKHMVVLSAGKIGAESEKQWNAMVRELGNLASFVKLGEIAENEASFYFSSLDYGLTSYPEELMGKSGSVAAMREHGLLVFACGSLFCDTTDISKKGGLKASTAPAWTVEQSAVRYLELLRKAT